MIMTSILITGSPGIGKSETIGELKRRGYKAYDTDDMPEITGYYDIATGERITYRLPSPRDQTKHAWNWQIPALKKLIDTDGDVFIGAITANTVGNLDLFDLKFALHASAETVKHRLKTRTTNDFAKHPEELRGVLESHEGSDDFWKNKGCIIINAEQPLEKVADDILQNLHEYERQLLSKE